MPIRFNASVAATPRLKPRRRGKGIAACTLLLALIVLLLWVHRGFLDYAFTGLFWTDTDGTVTTARRTSTPTIEFMTPDGAMHSFREDYILLCGGRHSFCWIRNFNPGQHVPVVYNPRDLRRAYVHDWALYATELTIFIEAFFGFLLVLALIMMVKGPIVLVRGPKSVSVSISTRDEIQD